MKSAQAEKWLASLFTTASLTSLISLICIATTWQYWTRTFDICIDINCGCILYGVNTITSFMGGNVKLCQFGTYGPIPAILLGFFLAVYYWYRTCISRSLDEPKIQMNFIRHDLDDVVVVRPKGRTPCKPWIPFALIAVVISCISLAHAVVVTDGYYKTCNQYRKNTIQMLGSRGHEVEVIYNRLSCRAIFDYMDYLQPDANYWARGDEMNTGLALESAIVCTWLNFFSWVLIFVLNCIMVRQQKPSSSREVHEFS